MISMLAFEEAAVYGSRFVIHLKSCVLTFPPYKEHVWTKRKKKEGLVKIE
jgi:hypothetical protein